MQQLSFNELQKNLTAIFDTISREHTAIKVAHGQQAVVLIDSHEYQSLIETLYLLQSKTNAERLQQSITQHQNGQVKQIDVNAYLD